MKNLHRRSRPQMPWPTLRLSALALAALCTCTGAQAAAVTDGSVGAVQTFSGAMTLPQTLGTVRGANLFHSFARFGIAAGESATFTTTDAGLRHVIARVTGGEPSLLQGPLTLRAAGGAQPDLWLVNPAGLLVGAGASFDVPAGLHLSSAPQLRFADGSTWATGSAAPSTLSVAAPESFGFLGGSSAAALRWQDADAVLAPGATLTLAGGEVDIERSLLLVPGGEIRVQAPGAVRLNQALLAATAPTAASAGRITIDAGSLQIAGVDGLRSGLLVDTAGGAGATGITLRVAGALALGRGTELSASSDGAGGGITIAAGSLAADAAGGTASINTLSFGSGAGPAVTLNVQGALTLAGGADIGTFAAGTGPAGDVSVRAGSLQLAGAGANSGSSIGSFGRPGALTIVSTGLMQMSGGTSIASANQGPLTPGAMLVQAGSLTLDGAGTAANIGSLTRSAGPAAALTVEVGGELRLTEGGQISVSTLGSGAGGALRVRADTLHLAGSDTVTGIFGGSLLATAGRSSAIEVDARLVDVLGTARISSTTLGDIGAGGVTVRADRITLDGRGTAGGIDSFAYSLFGDAGPVRVLARQEMVVRDGAGIIAGTLGTGSPGIIDVQAGTLLLDGRGAATTYTGIGGDALGSGAGAAVTVQADRIEMREGSAISSATFSTQDAGAVRVIAGTLRIDGGGNAHVSTGINAGSSGSGNAGSIAIVARDIEVVGDGGISTSTIGAGRGGSIDISAERVRLERGGAIFSVSAGSGDAGRIALNATESLTLAQGGLIVANTGGAGAAGLIDLRAGTMTVGGADPVTGQRSRISSRAIAGSGGQTGSIAITVAGALELQPDALLSIANDAVVADPAALTPTTIAVQAGSLTLAGADITAAASGNARAGAITLATAGRLVATGSRISTTAVDGDGGAIAIAAAGGVLLKDSAVTTSVLGSANGNGGDITIAGRWLALASGFVQANTTAPLARGGNVVVDVGLLVPDGSNVFVGGSRIASVRTGLAGYNVIQAAAPDGVAGTLELTRPELNVSGSLVTLLAPVIDFGLIGRDICAADTDSSFTVLGRGALPAPAAAPLRVSPRAPR